MIFYIVNAFTENLFGGNTAGVVLHDSIAAATMHKIASELRFSETAFVKILDKKNFEIRYFTSVSEVDLCGHATIAAFEALKELNLLKDSKSFSIMTKAGSLKVFIEKEDFFMEQAKPFLGDYIDDSDELASILGVDSSNIGDNCYNLMPQIVSTGLKDIILPLKDSKNLQQINPNFERLSLYSKKHGVVGVHAFTLDIHDHTALCRNFAPLYGIDEEAATGTSSGALTYYLFVNSIIPDKAEEISYLQGLSMGRPSIIKARITTDEKPRIYVGGRGRILSKGNLLI